MADDTRREWRHDGSVARYDPHRHTADELQLATDEEVERWAADLLGLRAIPEPRPTLLRLAAADALPWDGPTMDVVSSLDLADVVQVDLGTRAPPRSWRAVVARISHSITPGEWTADLDLQDPAAAGVGGYDSPTTRYETSEYGEAVML